MSPDNRQRVSSFSCFPLSLSPMCIACVWKNHKCFIYSHSVEQKTDKISKGIWRPGKWWFYHCPRAVVASQVRNPRWCLEHFYCDSDSGPLWLNELQTFTSITLYGTQMGQQAHALNKTNLTKPLAFLSIAYGATQAAV